MNALIEVDVCEHRGKKKNRRTNQHVRICVVTGSSGSTSIALADYSSAFVVHVIISVVCVGYMRLELRIVSLIFVVFDAWL